MSKPIKISPEDRVQRGEGTDYVIDNYITKNHSTSLSVAVSHLRGELWGTQNNASDRVYVLLDGHASFTFQDGTVLEAKKGDMILIPKQTGYKMSGMMDAVLINAPPFSPENEIEITPSPSAS